MSALKLRKLPDRTPVKISLTIMPDLHQQLQTYTDLYNETYATSETLGDLLPAMLNAFLESDRTFAQSRSRSS